MSIQNEQQNFWANQYATEYIKKNSQFDKIKGEQAWTKMLAKAGEIDSVLECGCNIGRNISFLENVLPHASKSIIEISVPAYEFVKSHYDLKSHFNGSIVESELTPNSFDLTFTCGVLIHIHPNDLLENLSKLFEYSKKYILVAEYFNRTPIMLEYQGEKDKLFKQDFGKAVLENFQVKLVDYGFLWGYEYDSAGFDDITWWLFEKQ